MMVKSDEKYQEAVTDINCRRLAKFSKSTKKNAMSVGRDDVD